MKKTPHLLWGIAFLVSILTSCAAVVTYEPLKPPSPGAVCPTIFPETDFRAVHRIEISSARSGKSAFIGAVKCEPDKSTLHAVLMSAEGMVIFEAAVKKGAFRIISAFPPLDDSVFARGLMADVSFLLLKPAGMPMETGLDRQGLMTCRWSAAAGGVIEQSMMRAGAVRIRRYNQAGRITKEALALPPFDRGLPVAMHLKVSGPVKYFIDLKLLEVKWVN
ncbi:MAG: hypothetical protein JXA41_09030 [Deltaproteobacteria bacterium]|nr:hypothetical protein [Deltaproteobacteria bacterium]